MAGDANNIIIGAAQVFVNGIDVGFTKGGAVVRYEQEQVEVVADQVVGIVKRARSLERMFVTTTMMEVTLERLRVAFMLPVNRIVGGNSLILGYNDACWVDEVSLQLIGPGPGSGGICGTRTWTFSKCVTFGEREYSMVREEETAFEIEFEVLKSDTPLIAGFAGTFGTLVDT